MSQAQVATGTAPAQSSQQPGGLGVAYLRGKLVFRRRVTRQGVAGFLQLLALPAPDQYSHPSTVEVFSAQPLGETGTEVSCKVVIGGYPRSYETKREDEDGRMERVTVRTADNTLTVVQ